MVDKHEDDTPNSTFTSSPQQGDTSSQGSASSDGKLKEDTFLEKDRIVTVEKEVVSEKTNSTDHQVVEYDEDDAFVPPSSTELNRLLWKLDLRIIPYISLLYLCSYLDRANIGNAKVAGLTENLGISDNEYTVALSIFYVGYVLFEVPSNLALKVVGPKIWIPAIMVTWGVIMAAMAAVNNGSGLMAARFFLGVAESGLYPGLLLYLSMWYTKQEQAKRIAWFFCSSTLAGAFGGVLAYGIMRMEGLRGLHGWQWIFIIEAIPTIFLAFVTYFVLPDYPEKTPILNEREKAIIVHRLKKDAGVASQKHFSWKQFRDTFLDWKTWYFACMYLSGSISVYSLSMFMPSIVKGMGYSNINAQAMSAPPYAFACVFCVLLAYSADYFMERGIHLTSTSFLAMVGYILLITLKDRGNVALFIAAIITTMGAFSAAPPVASWFSNNFGGHTKKAIAIAIIISAGSVGGAIAGQVYRADDAPHYVRGHTICAVLQGFCALASLLLKFIFHRINKHRANLTQEQRRIILEQDELCDWHPDFRYVL